MLDSNVDGNHPEDRELTARLYGGDHPIRIRQELLLGVGGVRALHAMGIFPGVVHLNEGHSALASLELTRHRMITEGIDAHEAIRRVAPQVVFTTHTPVPAGHDRFSSALVEEHLGPLGDSMALDHHGLMAHQPAHDLIDSAVRGSRVRGFGSVAISRSDVNLRSWLPLARGIV